MKNSKKELYYLKDLTVPKTPAQGEAANPWEKTSVIGKARPRVDAYERVSGAAVYPSDIVLPHMLYAAILRTPHPNSKIENVDISRAEKMPGVMAVITGNSPEADYQWPYSKEYKTKLFDSHCRFEGAPVAAVAAETPQQARDAARVITVDYDVLDFVVDEQKALEAGSHKVHSGGNTVKTET